MSEYRLVEVDGVEFADRIHAFNALESYFPVLKDHHLADGYWWMVVDANDNHVAFAGMVPFQPFARVGFFKRCYVLPDHVGHGLQLRLMCARELKARQLGFIQLISECLESNAASITNHRRAGFETFDPEQPWGTRSTVYWTKTLS
jgi:L-amino acid N-acyltransferase YncA